MRFEIFISGARSRSSSITVSIIIPCVAQHERERYKDEKAETLYTLTHNKNNTPVLAGACVFQEAKRRCARAPAKRSHKGNSATLKVNWHGAFNLHSLRLLRALSFPIQLTFHRINTELRVCLWSVGGGAKMEMGKRRAENITHRSRGIICEWRRSLSSMQHLTSCKRSSESAVEFLIAFFCSFRRLSLIFLHVAFVLPQFSWWWI